MSPRVAPMRHVIAAAILLCGCFSVPKKRTAKILLVREAIDFIQGRLDGCERMVEMSHIRDEDRHRARCYANAVRIIQGHFW